MINIFVGEFMFHPAPLELSGNYCSHDCIYCFANIRKNNRIIDMKGLFNQLNKSKVKNYTDVLINEGYPICLSNKSDPFSKSNYIHTIELAKQLNKRGNGLFIQTKGGYGIDEYLDIVKGRNNIIWYITITTNNEEIRKRIEPNAPTINERWILAEKLRKLGYLVILAINPLYEQWMPKNELIKFINKAKSININHIVVEALHLNKKEVKTFSPKRLSSFLGDEIKYSVEKKTFQNYVKEIIPILIENNVLFTKLGMPFKTEFYNDIKNIFGKIFPNQYDFINLCHKKGTGTYNFEEFYNITVDDKVLFERKFRDINAYLIKSNIHEWANNEEDKKAFSLKEVLRIIWNNDKYPQSLRRNQAFRTVVNKNNEIIKDNNQNILLYFDYGVYPTERIINIKSCKNEKNTNMGR